MDFKEDLKEHLKNECMGMLDYLEEMSKPYVFDSPVKVSKCSQCDYEGKVSKLDLYWTGEIYYCPTHYRAKKKENRESQE